MTTIKQNVLHTIFTPVLFPLLTSSFFLLILKSYNIEKILSIIEYNMYDVQQTPVRKINFIDHFDLLKQIKNYYSRQSYSTTFFTIQ